MVISILIGVEAYAQTKFSRKENQDLFEADYYMDLKDYGAALKICLELYKIDSTLSQLNYNIGKCLFTLNSDKTEAAKYLKHASDTDFREAHYYLAQCYHIQLKFDKAIALFQKYESIEKKKLESNQEVQRRIEIAKRAKQMMELPVDVEIINMGSTINSTASDYVPLINADESVLYFTSRRAGSSNNKLDPYGKYFEDIYYSAKENEKWTAPQKLNEKVNTELHDAAVSLSADGRTLIIYRTNQNLLSGDLFECVFEGNDWSQPLKLNDHINSQYVESSAVVSSDGNTLYFSSNRPGGYGGFDIYRVKKLNNGKWSMPLNVGGVINSPFNDEPSFLDPDNQTLYFNSKGHTTMGGYDIFKSHKVNDTTWSEPQNLGYPINTVEDNMQFVLSTDGERGYYSSVNKQRKSDQDIFIIRMPYPPRLLTLVKGIVTSNDSVKKPLQCKITVIERSSSEIQGVYKSNMSTGKYLLVLSPDVLYQLTIEAKGYKSTTEYVEFKRDDKISEFTQHITLERQTGK
ncbi:MAG: PD40 domain-containing protein [Flavobacteriales bacterium]|nr:PD40 domain-containing protein [Flavobacteriales bacterium]